MKKDSTQNGSSGQSGSPHRGAAEGARALPGGLSGWLLNRLRGAGRVRPRLMLLERIALAPRQSLALVEAEGRRFLVASSGDGAPAFYPLDEGRREGGTTPGQSARRSSALPATQPSVHSGKRVSW